MSDVINGTWNNSYGSSMQLSLVDQQIYGTYRSHTGSTGVYLLVGNCSSNAPTKAAGKNLAFSIFWRSIQGDKADDSWHWAGSMCGQLLADGQMTLSNTIVVSVPFEQFSKGNYVDELVFTKQSESSELDIPKLFASTEPKAAQAQPLVGTWANQTSQLTIQAVNMLTGLAKASLSQQEKTLQLLGFIDVYAGSALAQSFSFTGIDPKSQQTMSICGALEQQQTELTIYQWISQSTPADTSFMQARIAAQLLVKQAS
ncbi:avidin/streptavidin family protein [Agarivorans gilvus]|jgi:hypothetical protein|uniref:Uncharacterized protein n=1 Tax=Agarivorans gilvus TaxID=680279 RepID=A0ABQ1I6Q5_9ALTE|nr:avidin/streptavidin family protein [Agarivorans gilvus]GGB14172.1 hypothetical protein GCM10007414_29490 [Agarivorans gilvus]